MCIIHDMALLRHALSTCLPMQTSPKTASFCVLPGVCLQGKMHAHACRSIPHA